MSKYTPDIHPDIEPEHCGLKQYIYFLNCGVQTASVSLVPLLEMQNSRFYLEFRDAEHWTRKVGFHIPSR
jgi:hypothetical protein